MAESLAYQLCERGMVTDSLTMDVGYDRENCDNGSYRGAVHIDHYGRKVPKGGLAGCFPSCQPAFGNLRDYYRDC